jgi:hypothetical protein
LAKGGDVGWVKRSGTKTKEKEREKVSWDSRHTEKGRKRELQRELVI